MEKGWCELPVTHKHLGKKPGKPGCSGSVLNISLIKKSMPRLGGSSDIGAVRSKYMSDAGNLGSRRSLEDRPSFSSLTHPSDHPFQSTGRVLSVWLQPNSCRTAFSMWDTALLPRGAWNPMVTMNSHCPEGLGCGSTSMCAGYSARCLPREQCRHWCYWVRRDEKSREKMDFSGIWKGKESTLCVLLLRFGVMSWQTVLY